MHLRGGIAAQGGTLKVRHTAEVMAPVIVALQEENYPRR